MVVLRDRDEELSIELLERSPGGDARVRASVASLGFSGSYDDVWISADAARRFLRELSGVERDRRGTAVLEATSPGELRIAVGATDALGHMAATGHVGRTRASEQPPTEARVGFNLQLDPAGLTALAQSFAGLLAG